MSQKLKTSEKIAVCAALLSIAALVCFSMLGGVKNDAKTLSEFSYFDYAGEASVPENEKVNINTADKNALMTLPGIGEARAQAIIDYRTEHGDFMEIDDIVLVNGIGNAMFVDMMDLITVN